MELKLDQPEVEKIILEWAETKFPRMFNTINFKSYGNEVELLFIVPGSDKNPEVEDKKENE